MQTVTLKFDLPEDQYSLNEALNGTLYKQTLEEISDYLRSLYKYRSDEVQAMDPMDLLIMIREHVAELIPKEP